MATKFNLLSYFHYFTYRGFNFSRKSFWLQRSGSLITILGVWIAFHESRESLQTINGSIFINPELPYKWLALILITVGTLLWGYGDLPFK